MPDYFTLIGDKAPPTTRESNEAVRIGVVILTPETAVTVGV